MGYGIRVVLVMNRKGGSGKSTLCRALASAAAAKGETVTIFDTDASKSCLKWMQAGKEAGKRQGRSVQACKRQCQAQEERPRKEGGAMSTTGCQTQATVLSMRVK